MAVKSINPASLITTFRIFLVAIFALVLSFFPGVFGLWPGIIIIVIIFALDSADGFVARKFGYESKFGAFYDITGDRIVELVMLIPFLYLQLITPVLPVYFIVKGALVDYSRLKQFSQSDEVPFKQLKSKLAAFLVASRFMRGLYGVCKMLLIIVLYVVLFNETKPLVDIKELLVVATLMISLLRSLPSLLRF